MSQNISNSLALVPAQTREISDPSMLIGKKPLFPPFKPIKELLFCSESNYDKYCEQNPSPALCDSEESVDELFKKIFKSANSKKSKSLLQELLEHTNEEILFAKGEAIMGKYVIEQSNKLSRRLEPGEETQSIKEACKQFKKALESFLEHKVNIDRINVDSDDTGYSNNIDVDIANK